MSQSINHLLHINASVKKVFNAISNIDELKIWYTMDISGKLDLNEIIEFKFGEVDFHTKVIDLIPNEKLVLECVFSGIPAIGHQITYLIDQNNDKTRVRFKHEGFNEIDDFFANMNFSSAKYLESLRQYCQKGTSEAFGSEGYRS